MAITLYEQKFRDTLAEIFQMDQAELDFGIYRIMNQKRKDIEAFLDNRLVPEVRAVLKASAASDDADIPAMENEVFSHLARFFSRYYEGGDFISKRRYKDDAYAIPYSGEEVKLYWANADQYYIKTSEYFKNYAFLLPVSRRKVHFVLRDAETEQNNNKTANNMERRFQLCKDDFIELSDGELNIYFTYELMPKSTKQDALIKSAEETILPLLAGAEYAAFGELATKAPTEKNRERTLLLKHLQDYTAKNNFDYFIHKDLGGFLRRELDFYIKNEVMFLDDLDANHILDHLAQVKAIKQVGEKIIAFLAQLEDFQKKLWLKKKFVVGCDYCVTLDRIPRALYPEIVANDAQRQEWVRLFAIDEIKGDMMTEGYCEPLTEKFLEDNPFLVLDTKFFSAEFKHKLVGSMENVDEECNGLLINSENFQALELLQEKYRERINGIYVDPPYNTSASEINYKNNYKHSSWLSMIYDRFYLGRNLLTVQGIQCSTIDDVENSKLNLLISSIYGGDNIVGVVPIKINPSGRPTERGFALTHEYGIFSGKSNVSAISKIPRSDEQMSRYNQKDSKGVFEWRNLRREGSNSDRENGERQFYPIYGNLETGTIRVPKIYWNEEKRQWFLCEGENIKNNEVEIYPINDGGREKNWRWSEENVRADYSNFLVRIPQGSERPQVYYKYRPNMEGITPLTMWTDSKFYPSSG